MPHPNPKKAYGDKKPALAQIPLVAKIHCSLALMDGANKYGFRNWRKDPVEALTYVHAAERHLELWKEGEDLTRDTKIKNLGAVMACCAILMDAEVNGTLLDNRDHSPAACDALYEAEAIVAMLNAMQKVRDVEKAAAESVAVPPFMEFVEPAKPTDRPFKSWYETPDEELFQQPKKDGED